MFKATIADTTASQSVAGEVLDKVEMTFFEGMQMIWDFLGTTLFSLKTTDVTIGSVITFFVMITLVVFVSKLVSNLLYRRVLKNVAMDEGIRYTLQRITNYTILVLGVIFSFQFIGVDFTSFAVVFGLLSVGIGFGLQNLTSNFISGIILLFERPIKVGDRIIVNELEGDVKEINIRSTTINTIDNISIIVPNSEFISGSVVNYSHGDSKIRLNVDVGVSYSSDLDLVLKTLKKAATDHKEVQKSPIRK